MEGSSFCTLRVVCTVSKNTLIILFVCGVLMNILFALIVIVIVVGILIALKAKKAKPGYGLAFTSRGVLFTPAERSFFGILEQALDSRYRIFGKVRLGDIVSPVKGLTRSKQTTARNWINQKHVDFVICTATDLALIGVLELDDKSHECGDRVGRDDFVDRALAMAKIPIVHFPAKKGYAVQEVRARLAEMLSAATKPDITSKLQETFVPSQPALVEFMEAVPVQSVPAEPVCPKCAAAMVKRQAAKGEHAGKWFWACSEFPKCRQVVVIGDG